MTNNYDRFSQKVQDYIKYRPEYPEDMVKVLMYKLNLGPEKIIAADIGSGTGLSSKPFLDYYFKVYGVEPNYEMRKAAEEIFKDNKYFVSIDGTSEKTNLEDNSVDIILCGQAFHWFDLIKTKKEFKRILNPSGNIVIVWNERNTSSPLQYEYDQILNKNIEEYKFVNHKNIDKEVIRDFLSPRTMNELELENSQYFDLEGLIGRVKSSSYTPKSGKVFDKILLELEHLFKKYESNGSIEFKYKTKIYFS